MAYLVVPGAIYLTVAILSGMNIGTRRVLFLYPLAALLAAAGLTALAQHSRRWIGSVEDWWRVISFLP